jgi:alpha-glucoside transport system substrate-binding protein
VRANRRRQSFAALALVAALAAGGCGSSDNEKTSSSTGAKSTPASANVSGKVSIVGIWTAAEQKSFQKVLDAFQKQYPKVTVKYNPAGDNTPTVLSTAVSGGNPPDLASVGQPGFIKELQTKGALKPIEFARSTLEQNYPADIVKLGEIDGKLFSFIFKAANKSTVWYNVDAFKNAGVEPPQTWDDFTTAAKTLKASGTPAYSLGGADGWTLTDLFENIYLRQAGGEKYDQLSNHEIKWTDASVKDALTTMKDITGDKSNIAGGTSGALQTDFPTSVSNVFASKPKAAMVIEGDFVPGVVGDKNPLKPKTGYDEFAFPAIGDATNAVMGGGDSIIMFKSTPASQALIKYLASPEAAEIRAKEGGFSSPNKNVPSSAYPDEIQRGIAEAISKADPFRFDMSDLAPAAFGGTPGQGEWKILQDFLSNGDVDGTASKLEAAAAKAFK